LPWVLFVLGGVGDEVNELVGKSSRDPADYMACTSYARVLIMSEYWTRVIEVEDNLSSRFHETCRSN
jgi:hypothetical protein